VLIVVRHGHTSFNEDGTERLRGWLPIPLTLEGMKLAHETGEALEDAEGIKHLYCSDLVRAVQTATEMGELMGMVIEPKEELRDWNYGELTGEVVEKALPKLKEFMRDPLKKVPGGEPYQNFLDRCIPFLRELVESKDLQVAVTHARVIIMLKALCSSKGKEPDESVLMKKCPIEPSGIMIIKDWKIVFTENIEAPSTGVTS
jgi:probable phosphoglycerate mutase